MQTEVKEHPTLADIQDEDCVSSDTFYYNGKIYRINQDFSITEEEDGNQRDDG